jgi:hypothetical protein
MKKLPDQIKYINLDTIGEITGLRYSGAFRVKVLLTHADRFAIERAYKLMLPNDSDLSDEIKLRAASIAELEQRVVEAPKFWLDSRGGRDLVDAQPVYDLIGEAYKKLEEWKQDLNKVANPEAEDVK